jgi:glycopeptide antibiotics resistance protein
MLNYAIVAIIYLGWRVLRLSLSHRWKSSIRHEVGLLLLVLAVAGVLVMTLTGRLFTFGYVIVPQTDRRLNLTLFKCVKTAYHEWENSGQVRYLVTNVIGNIAVFVPLGLLFPLCFRRKAVFGVLFGFVTSLCIEVLQYPIGRWSDVDDLWLNTLGAGIGVLLFLGLKAVAPKLTSGFRVR